MFLKIIRIFLTYFQLFIQLGSVNYSAEDLIHINAFPFIWVFVYYTYCLLFLLIIVETIFIFPFFF